MKNIVVLFLQITIVFLIVTSNVVAGGNHAGETRKKPHKVFSPTLLHTEKENVNSIKGKLLNTLYIDDYEVSVKVVDVKESVPDGGSHNILVNIIRDDRIQRSAVVIVDILFPDNTRKSKELMNLGDWYLAGYDLGQTGKHQLKISFKNKNGSGHSADLVYP